MDSVFTNSIFEGKKDGESLKLSEILNQKHCFRSITSVTFCFLPFKNKVRFLKNIVGFFEEVIFGKKEITISDNKAMFFSFNPQTNIFSLRVTRPEEFAKFTGKSTEDKIASVTISRGVGFSFKDGYQVDFDFREIKDITWITIPKG